MKRIEITKMLSAEVARLMSEGWYLLPCNVSFGGVRGSFFLTIDEGFYAGKMCSVFIEESWTSDGEIVELKSSVVDLELRSDGTVDPGWEWRKPENCGILAIFSKVSEDWYTDDAEAAEDVAELRRDRFFSRLVLEWRTVEREVSDSLLALVRKHRGWSRVKKSDLVVIRHRSHYQIRNASKDGAVLHFYF